MVDKPIQVQLTTEQQHAYWVEVERRLPIWWSAKIGTPVPELPDEAAVFAYVTFKEVRGETCYYLDEARVIRVPPWAWNDGCVPHELMHAGLHMINHPCAPYVEHDTDAEKCREALGH